MRARLTAVTMVGKMRERALSRSSGNLSDEVRFSRAVSAGRYAECLDMINACASGEERAHLVNTSSEDLKDKSVLMAAITFEYPSIVRLLLTHGADPTFKVNGSSALNCAVESNRPYICKLVMEAYITEAFLSRDLFMSSRELESHFANPAERTVARRFLVDVYASMSVEELVRGVPRDFLHAPGQVLVDLMELAAATQRKARRMRAFEPIVSDDLSAASDRIQLVAAGCLRSVGDIKDGLGRWQTDELLRTPRGVQALRTAIMFECRAFLSQPEVQKFVAREWHGPLLNGAQGTSHRAQHLACLFSSAVGCILLLPLVALFPFVDSIVFDALSKHKVESAKMRVSSKRRASVREIIDDRDDRWSDAVEGENRTTNGVEPPSPNGRPLGVPSPPASPPSSPMNKARRVWAGVGKQASFNLSPSRSASTKPPAQAGPKLVLADLWLFRVPLFKFACRQTSSIAMAITISAVDTAVLGKGGYALFDARAATRCSTW